VIDVLIPVLGRPQNAAKVYEAFHAVARLPIDILFLCSAGDDAEIAACAETGADIDVHDYGGRYEYPQKMNRGFRLTRHPWLLLAADDVEPAETWDLHALSCWVSTERGVIGTNDCVNSSVMRGDYSTHPLVRRDYVREQGASLDGPGILCHEGYDHNYTDVEIARVAQSRDQWVYCPSAIIEHRHHVFADDVARDETYVKGFRFFRRDRQTHLRRMRRL
jgi:hypothetical protein